MLYAHLNHQSVQAYSEWPTANDFFHAEVNQAASLCIGASTISFEVEVVDDDVQFSISSRVTPFPQDLIASIQEIFEGININVSLGPIPTTPAQLSWRITKKELFEDVSMLDALADILINRVFGLPLSLKRENIVDHAYLRKILQLNYSADYIVQKFINEKEARLRMTAASKEVLELDLAVEISNHLFMNGFIDAHFILATYFAKKNMFEIAEKLYGLVPNDSTNYQKAQENQHFLKAGALSNSDCSSQELALLLKAGGEKNVSLKIARNISAATGFEIPEEAMKDNFIDPAESLDTTNIATAFSVMAIHIRQQKKMIEAQAKIIEQFQNQMELYSRKVNALEQKFGSDDESDHVAASSIPSLAVAASSIPSLEEVQARRALAEGSSFVPASYTPYLDTQSVKQQTLASGNVMQGNTKTVANDTHQDASVSLGL